jgi:hypothetical protein
MRAFFRRIAVVIGRGLLGAFIPVLAGAGDDHAATGTACILSDTTAVTLETLNFSLLSEFSVTTRVY